MAITESGLISGHPHYGSAADRRLLFTAGVGGGAASALRLSVLARSGFAAPNVALETPPRGPKPWPGRRWGPDPACGGVRVRPSTRLAVVAWSAHRVSAVSACRRYQSIRAGHVGMFTGLPVRDGPPPGGVLRPWCEGVWHFDARSMRRRFPYRGASPAGCRASAVTPAPEAS